MAAANRRLVCRSVAGDHSDHRLRLARPLVMARATTPWKRAWDGQRWLKMWESFQSAATGASAVIRLARVSRPRPAWRPMAVEARSIRVLLVGAGGRLRDPRGRRCCGQPIGTPTLGRTSGGPGRTHGQFRRNHGDARDTGGPLSLDAARE